MLVVGDTPIQEVKKMKKFPHLLGQKEVNDLSDQQMADIIGVSRNTYSKKIRNGKFAPDECIKYCLYFKKDFQYLFAEN